MKFKDIKTGAILDTDNEFVILQFKKHAERYKEVKEIKEKNRSKIDK